MATQNQPNDSTNDDLLAELSRAKITEYTPVIVYVAVVILLGIIGNIMTVIFYGFKTLRHTTTTFFITSLAAIDLITCVILSDEIIGLCFTVTYRSSGGCKFVIFINHLFVVSSIFVLWLIGVDRYLKICRPLGRVQFRMTSCKVAVVLACGVGLASAIREVVTSDVEQLNITNAEGLEVMGYYCTQSHNPDLQNAIRAFNILDLLIVVLVMVSSIILYALIVKTIVKSTWGLRKSMYVTKSHGRRVIAKESNTTGRSEVELSDNTGSHARDDVNCPVACDDNIHGNTQESKIERSPSVNPSASTIELRLVFMTAVINAGFIVTFMPYFVVNLTLSQLPINKQHTVGIQLALRSFILNSAINPYIIGFFNVEFRNFVKSFFCRSCRANKKS